MDETRKKLGKNAILPLQGKESHKYINVSIIIFENINQDQYYFIQLASIRLTRGERLRVVRSASSLLISTFHVASMLAVDYCLYWILAKVRFYGRLQGGLKGS